MVTYFVVVGFQLGKGGVLVADQPRQVMSEAQCLGTARRLAEGRAGVIAFSRKGSPATGDWDDAVVLFQSGVVPEEAFAMAS
jgi:hypothetical protein